MVGIHGVGLVCFPDGFEVVRFPDGLFANWKVCMVGRLVGWYGVVLVCFPDGVVLVCLSAPDPIASITENSWSFDSFSVSFFISVGSKVNRYLMYWASMTWKAQMISCSSMAKRRSMEGVTSGDWVVLVLSQSQPLGLVS